MRNREQGFIDEDDINAAVTLCFDDITLENWRAESYIFSAAVSACNRGFAGDFLHCANRAFIAHTAGVGILQGAGMRDKGFDELRRQGFAGRSLQKRGWFCVEIAFYYNGFAVRSFEHKILAVAHDFRIFNKIGIRQADNLLPVCA